MRVRVKIRSDMFQEGISDDQIKRGYCYDYLQKVSDYTNWEYEYVYDSWTELFRKLQRGEIDLLAQTINNVLSLDGIDITAKIGKEPG